jgi:succinyl-CoA synthetase beta subunit
MNIHEFQAKQILRRFNVPVPKGESASSPEEMAKAFETLGLPRAVA